MLLQIYCSISAVYAAAAAAIQLLLPQLRLAAAAPLLPTVCRPLVAIDFVNNTSLFCVCMCTCV